MRCDMRGPAFYFFFFSILVRRYSLCLSSILILENDSARHPSLHMTQPHALSCARYDSTSSRAATRRIPRSTKCFSLFFFPLRNSSRVIVANASRKCTPQMPCIVSRFSPPTEGATCCRQRGRRSLSRGSPASEERSSHRCVF